MFLLLPALALSIGWGIRGNFGHEAGAMIPGALAAMAAALVSGRADWLRRIAYFGFFGALGWSFGGSISYMQVIAYTHSGHSPSVLYGFACLFVIGFLWAAMGGAGTALPAVLDREALTEFFPPLSAVFAAWVIQSTVVGLLDAHSPDFRHESVLYWYDTDWLGVLVALAAVLLLALVRRRWDRATSLIVHMGVGWWMSFLVLVVGLGWRMTPPRGDNWAGCLGMVAGMLLYFHQYRLPALTFATLVSGFVGGLGFAVATSLKLVEIRSGLDTNWHSILEQTYGLINGIGIGVMMLALSRRAPEVTDAPPRRRWTDVYSALFVLLFIPYVNLVKCPEEWVKAKTMPAVMAGLSAGSWFHLSYAVVTIAVVLLVARQLRNPLAIVPESRLGRAQLLFLLLLWTMVVGNWERVLPMFTAQRLVTEGVISTNAVIATVLLLLCTGETVSCAPERKPAYPTHRALSLGLTGAVLGILACWGLTRAVWGDCFAGYAKLHIRFGPRSTATTEKPKAGLPHP